MRRITLLLTLLVVFGAVQAAQAQDLSPTPYMGWGTFYADAGQINETTIVAETHALVSRGLARAGYKVVWFDWGWAWNLRNPDGSIAIDAFQWPHGMAWIAAYIHRLGLEAGIYTDAGASGCGDYGLGSYGHYQQDANTFAAWGFDAVKLDFCGAAQAHMDPRLLGGEFAYALRHNSSGRPMMLDISNLWTPGQTEGTLPKPSGPPGSAGIDTCGSQAHIASVWPSYADSTYDNYSWASCFATSWRTDTDIAYPGGKPDFRWRDTVRNLDADAMHPGAAHPGHWSNPDALGVGWGLSPMQGRAQLSVEAALAAPLMIGADPRRLSRMGLAMLTNPRMLAVDQDPLGRQGRLVYGYYSQTFERRLSGGRLAVTVMNTTGRERRVKIVSRYLDLGARSHMWTNVWTGTVRRHRGSFYLRVPATGALMFTVRTNGLS